MKKEKLPLIFSLWEKVDHAVARVEGALVIVALLAMILMTFSQVVMRNLFSSGVVWFDPVVRHLLLWIGFLGGSLATREKRHITVDAVSGLFKGQSRHGVNIVVTSVGAFVCGVLFLAACHFVQNTLKSGDTINAVVPAWIAQAVLPYAFFMMTARFMKDGLIHCWRAANRLAPEVSFAAHAAADSAELKD